MAVFSFKAECPDDLGLFRQSLNRHGHPYRSYRYLVEPLLLPPIPGEDEPRDFGDRAVEIEIDLTIEQLRDIMKEQPDSHYMVQSLRQMPLAENSLERVFPHPKNKE
jgi:hypothetical protein